MGDMLKELREKSRKRKMLLAQTVSKISNSLTEKCEHDFQLGVSGAEELREVLGTAESPIKKRDNLDNSHYQENDKYDYKKDAADELVYRDSSMFLKVNCYNTVLTLFRFDLNIHFRVPNHLIRTTTIANTSQTPAKDLKTSSVTQAQPTGLKNTPNSGNS